MIVSIVLWYMLCDGFTYFSQRVGVTTTLPDRVPDFLPLNGAGPHEWHYTGQSLWHDGSYTKFPHLPSLHELSTHQTVGLLISTNGQLHVYINGRHSECIASGLLCVHGCCGSKSVHTCIMYMYMYDRALATAIQLATEYN